MWLHQQFKESYPKYEILMHFPLIPICFMVFVCPRVLPKKAMVVRFTKDETAVVLGDKTGEVYLYSLEQWSTPGVHLLGHFSILLDMVGRLYNNYYYYVWCARFI